MRVQAFAGKVHFSAPIAMPSKKDHIPKQIKVSKGQELAICWNDGFSATLSASYLREHCPCATCQQQSDRGTTQLPIFRPRPTIMNVKPVGNYAIQIIWSDGHQAGIYTYEILRNLAESSSKAGLKDDQPRPRDNH